MTDLDMLRDVIKRKGLRHEYLAKQLGVTETEFSRKMTGKSGFNQAQISTLADVLELSDKETVGIFLSKSVT